MEVLDWVIRLDVPQVKDASIGKNAPILSRRRQLRMDARPGPMNKLTIATAPETLQVFESVRGSIIACKRGTGSGEYTSPKAFR